MKRHSLSLVLLVTSVWVAASHLAWTRQDDTHLLWVDGRAVDVLGAGTEILNRWSRQCDNVNALLPTHAVYAQTLQVLQGFSPPDSASAQVVQLLQAGPWLIAEVQFAKLQTAVVVARSTEQGVTLLPSGIWSGATHPLRPNPLVRRYLQARVPTLPATLLACFDARTL